MSLPFYLDEMVLALHHSMIPQINVQLSSVLPFRIVIPKSKMIDLHVPNLAFQLR